MVLGLGLLVDDAEIIARHLAVLLPDADVEDHAQLKGEVLHLQLLLPGVSGGLLGRDRIGQGRERDQQQ